MLGCTLDGDAWMANSNEIFLKTPERKATKAAKKKISSLLSSTRKKRSVSVADLLDRNLRVDVYDAVERELVRAIHRKITRGRETDV